MEDNFQKFFSKYGKEFSNQAWFKKRVYRRNEAFKTNETGKKEALDLQVFQAVWDGRLGTLVEHGDLDQRRNINKIEFDNCQLAIDLISRGATNDFTYVSGGEFNSYWTVCDVAFARGCIELIEIISQKWPEEVYKKSLSFQTPLGYAFIFDQRATVKWFVEQQNAKDVLFSWVKASCSGGHPAWQLVKAQPNIIEQFKMIFGNFGTESQGLKILLDKQSPNHHENVISQFSAEFGDELIEQVFNRYGVDEPLTNEPLLIRIKRSNGKMIFLVDYFKEHQKAGAITLKKKANDKWVYSNKVSKHKIYEVEDEDIINYLNTSNIKELELDLDRVLGSSYNEIIIQKSVTLQEGAVKCAIRYGNYNPQKSGIDGGVLNSKIYNQYFVHHLSQSPEFCIAANRRLRHKNLMVYLDFTVSTIREEYFHVSVTNFYPLTLWQLLEHDELSQALSFHKRVEIVESVWNGVRHLHGCGLGVHKDIKLHNILIDTDSNGEWNGELVLTDFGISCSNSTSRRSATPGFGSPEQFAQNTVDRSTDTYSFAKVCVLTLFNWTTGWNLLYHPSNELDMAIWSKDSVFNSICSQMTKMLKVQPDERCNLDQMARLLTHLKKQNGPTCAIRYDNSSPILTVSIKLQDSVDLACQISKLIETPVGDANKVLIHGQKVSKLCHAFAAVYSFSNAIQLQIQKQKGEKFKCRQKNLKLNGSDEDSDMFIDEMEIVTSDTYRHFGKLVKDAIKDDIHFLMGGFLGCVSPSSFNGFDTDYPVKTVMERLSLKTAFECEGWKRIPRALELFRAFDLSHDDFKLEVVQVAHPLARAVKILNQPPGTPLNIAENEYTFKV